MSNKSVSQILSVFMLFFCAAVWAQEEAPVKKKPGYVSLGDKPMVLNLSSEGKRLSFLQVKADVLVKDDVAKEIVEANIPPIRHKLIVELSEQKAIDLKTPAKREEIRKQLTSDVRDMIEQMTNNNDIDQILFSTFLIQ